MLLAAGLGLVGCGDDSATAPGAGSGGIVISEATVDKPVDGQPNAGAFAKIHNGTDNEIVIVGASSPVTPDVQLHTTITGDDDTTTMKQIESFPVAAGADFAFEHGGPHIMLMNVDDETFPDTEVPITLMLSDGTEIPFTAGVMKMMEDTVPSTTAS